MKYLIGAALLASTLTQAADLSITEAKARAVPPTAQISAAFMTIANNASGPLAMVGADSSVADSVELHDSTMTDGKMKMRHVNQIELPANQSIELKPGGLHIMLIGLKTPLVVGESVDLTLQFSDGTTEVLALPIEHIMPGMKH